MAVKLALVALVLALVMAMANSERPGAAGGREAKANTAKTAMKTTRKMVVKGAKPMPSSDFEREGARPVCSSLDGPSFVKWERTFSMTNSDQNSGDHERLGLDGSNTNSMTLNELLASVFSTLAENGGNAKSYVDNFKRVHPAAEGPGKVYAEGHFTMRATYFLWNEKMPAAGDAGNTATSTTATSNTTVFISAEPDQWILRPGADWVMIGLEGSIRRSPSQADTLEDAAIYTLEAVLVDVDRIPLPSCSKLQAFARVQSGNDSGDLGSWDDIFAGQTWKGQYVCGGLPTEVELTLSHAKEALEWRLPGRGLEGTFRFTAKTPGSSLSKGKNGESALDVRLTEAGCKCKSTWEAVYKRPDGQTVREVVRYAACGNPGAARSRDFCAIEPDSCESAPESASWDYCVKDWRTLHENARAQAASSRAGKGQKFSLTLDGDIPVFEQQREGYGQIELSLEDLQAMLKDLGAQAGDFIYDMLSNDDWNVDSTSNAYTSLMVNFQDAAACEPLGSYFAQTIASVQVRGGASDDWEGNLAFDNSLMEKAFHFLTDDNTTQSFLAVQVGLVHWLPNFFVRTVSLNVVARTESRVSVHIGNPVLASEACPYAWNESSAPMNAALTHYLLQTAGQVETMLFSAEAAQAEEASLSGQRWLAKEAWTCTAPSSDMIPPDQVCQMASDQAFFRPSYYVFVAIWAAFAIVCFIWFVVFVRAFLRDRVSSAASSKPTEATKEQAAKGASSAPGDESTVRAPGAGEQPSATAETAAVSNEDEDRIAQMEVETDFAIGVLRTMLVIDVDLTDASVGPKLAAKQYCVLLLPALLPMLWSIELACDMNEVDCTRRVMIQLPIFYVVAAYSGVVAVFLIGSVWKIYPGNALRLFLRALTILLSSVSVLMLCTHLLWLAVALTVDPLTAGSRIIGLLSIFIYAQQTLSKARSTYAQMVARLIKAGHTGAELESELEKRGFSKRQLVSLLWISTSALLLAFVWCVLCGVIFYANRPGTPGGSVLSFFTGAVIPFAAAVMHIANAVKSKAKVEDVTPLQDLVADAEAASEESNLSNALQHVADTIKKLEKSAKTLNQDAS
ncbi:Hypothetical Protein FCC1311_089422 [Hondaea fermentalgiana]|uniref:Uncharacterized protein n=1 Tax=Hondaea fermentalgiana TaxID=2315210 RepID=A0A2R5GPC4_9STRA|nr:Hypothetical Protein FCC1311_089422 [Hondaea fermentalgiana]|eukprot:GBG32717.1 Hypothetical Protein FCC1311_089422 [Hondaea fermentalgiana]